MHLYFVDGHFSSTDVLRLPDILHWSKLQRYKDLRNRRGKVIPK